MGISCLKKFIFVSTENKIVIVSFVNKVLLNDFGTSEDDGWYFKIKKKLNFFHNEFILIQK